MPKPVLNVDELQHVKLKRKTRRNLPESDSTRHFTIQWISSDAILSYNVQTPKTFGQGGFFLEEA